MFEGDACARLMGASRATDRGDNILFSRLKELDASHRREQEQLLREQSRQKELLAKQRTGMPTNLDERSNPSGSSDPSGSGDDEKRDSRRPNRPLDKPNTRPNKFDESSAVSGSTVPFHFLIDHKLKEDTPRTMSTGGPGEPRKFLKRGEGLMRFGPKYAKGKWRRSGSPAVKGSKPEEKQMVTVPEKPASRQAVMKPKDDFPKPRESTDSEIRVNILSPGKKERKDLQVFEILEEAAEHSSFCSTGSYFEGLLRRRERVYEESKSASEPEDPTNEEEPSSSTTLTRNILSSSPVPREVLHNEWESRRASVMEGLHDYFRTFDWVGDGPPNLKAALEEVIEEDSTRYESSPEKSRESPERDRLHQHVRFNEMVQKMTFPVDSRTSVGSDSESETASELENPVEQPPSSSIPVEPVIPKPKPKFTRKPYRPAMNRSRMGGRGRPKPKNPMKSARSFVRRPATVEEEPVTEEEHEEGAGSQLNPNAEQLNREMAIFKRENERVLALRRQLEAEKRKLQTTREKMAQDAVEQGKLAQKKLREEEDKLKRDRLAFEKFRREQKLATDAKLAEENRLLKLELKDMEAEVRDKDAKHGSAQSRFKMTQRKLENTIDELKATVTKLKADNEKLEAENDKLKKQVSQLKAGKGSQGGSNPNAQKITKKIHEANDYISKTFFSNPGNPTRKSDPQPLKGLLKKSDSGPKPAETTVKIPPLKQQISGQWLREESEKLEKRLMEEKPVSNGVGGVEFASTRRDVNRKSSAELEAPIVEKVKPRLDYDEGIDTLRSERSRSDSEPSLDYHRSASVSSVRRQGDGQNVEKETPNPTKSQETSLDLSANPYFESERVLEDGTIERTLADGRKECVYPNGNRKVTSKDGKSSKMVYYTGDVQEKLEDGTIEYFYAESRTWHTTKPDGTEIIEYPSGDVKVKKPNGEAEITTAGGMKILQKPDGSETKWRPDGSRVEKKPTGEKIIYFANGEQQVETIDYKKRVFVDGTEKIIYNDGRQETRYSNGRLRIRDSRGNLIVDCFA